MSDLDVVIDSRIARFQPERIPPFEALHARRRRAVRTRIAAATLVAACAIGVGAWLTGALPGVSRTPALLPATQGPLTGGTVGLSTAPAFTTPLRPLPGNALLQFTFAGGHGIPPQPEVPQIVTRVYEDGTILSSTGRNVADRWQQTRLSPSALAEFRALAAAAGLAAGSRDYGQPTNGGFAGIRIVFQARGEAGPVVSAVDYGGTVNGLPSSDAALTAAERAARTNLAALNDLLSGALRAGTTTYQPETWSRYAQANRATAAIDVAVAPVWAPQVPISSGGVRADGLRCVPVSDPVVDAGRRYADGQYRVGSTAWLVRYDPVLPGEQPCTALAD